MHFIYHEEVPREQPQTHVRVPDRKATEQNLIDGANHDFGCEEPFGVFSRPRL